MLRRKDKPPKAPKLEPVDPWAVPMPWRDQVRAVVDAQSRFERAAAGLEDGPARERIQPYLARVDAAVRQGAAAAQRAAVIATPQRAAAAIAVSAELADLQRGGPPEDDSARRHEDALAAQLRSLRRAETTGRDSLDQLRLLASRIDDAATALVELSVDLSATLEGDASAGLLSVFDEIDALHAGMVASARAVDPASSGVDRSLDLPRPPSLGTVPEENSSGGWGPAAT